MFCEHRPSQAPSQGTDAVSLRHVASSPLYVTVYWKPDRRTHLDNSLPLTATLPEGHSFPPQASVTLVPLITQLAGGPSHGRDTSVSAHAKQSDSHARLPDGCRDLWPYLPLCIYIAWLLKGKDFSLSYEHCWEG